MFNTRINILKTGCLFFALIVFSSLVYADDVEDSIKEALQYYKDGEYKDAVENLGYASQLIQQKKGKSLELLLPKPLSGWTTQETKSQAAGTAMFGGGITAERKYSKGSSSISIKIITDSPIMQGMIMMFSNPMLATSGGGKLERIGRQKAIVKFNPKTMQGEIKIVVASRFFVIIKGRKITIEDLKEYANAIDYKKLKSLS